MKKLFVLLLLSSLLAIGCGAAGITSQSASSLPENGSGVAEQQIADQTVPMEGGQVTDGSSLSGQANAGSDDKTKPVIKAEFKDIKTVLTDQSNKKAIEGAVITIVDSNGKVVATVTTNANGEAIFTFSVAATEVDQNYKVIIKKDGYTTDGGFVMEISNLNDLAALVGSIALSPIIKTIDVVLTDTQGNAINGATIVITNSQGQTVGSDTTEGNGSASFSVNAAENKQDDTYTATITHPYFNDIIITADSLDALLAKIEDLQDNSSKFVKTMKTIAGEEVVVYDTENKPLFGAKISITNSEGNVSTVTTNSSGKAVITYSLILEIAEKGFTVTIDSERYKTFNKTGVSFDEILAQISNARLERDLAVYSNVIATLKDQSNNKAIEGAVIEVVDSNGKIVATVTTNASGIATFDFSVDAADVNQNYKVIITKEGYGDNNKFVHEITSLNNLSTVLSQVLLAPIIKPANVVLKDSEGNAISGASIVITNSQVQTVGSDITDASGSASFSINAAENKQNDSYTATITHPYYTDSNGITVTAGSLDELISKLEGLQNNASQFVKTIVGVTGETVVIKDLDGNVLANTTITIQDGNGNVYSFTTDENGQAVINFAIAIDIAQKGFTVTISKDGYDTKEINVSSVNDIISSISGTLLAKTIKNYDFSMTVVDQTSTTPLSGVSFTVKNSSGTIVGTTVFSDGQGNISSQLSVTVDEIPGNYTAEISKGGYFSNVYSANSLDALFLLLYNKDINISVNSVVINKTITDIYGNALPNTTVTVKNADGTTAGTGVTNSSGLLTMTVNADNEDATFTVEIKNPYYNVVTLNNVTLTGIENALGSFADQLVKQTVVVTNKIVKITDVKTGAVVAGAAVVIKDNAGNVLLSGTTLANGTIAVNFTVDKDVSEKPFSLSLSMNGYKSESFSYSNLTELLAGLAIVKGIEKFNYATVTNLAVELILKDLDSGSAIQYAGIEIFNKAETQKLSSGITDVNGTSIFQVSTESSNDGIVIVIKHTNYTPVDGYKVVVDDIQDLSSILRTISLKKLNNNTIVDGDDDNVSDDNDDGQTDPNYAKVVTGEFILVYEDQYPTALDEGNDSDYNDAVIKLIIEEQINADNKVAKIILKTQVIASGSGGKHAFGINIRAAGQNVLQRNLISHIKKELLENGVQRDNASYTQTNFFVTNTRVVEWTPATPLNRTDLAPMPYDPYLIPGGAQNCEPENYVYVPGSFAYNGRTINERKELHLSFVETSYTGPTTHFAKNQPWAIMVPNTWKWPYEINNAAGVKCNIYNAYPDFKGWYESKGVNFKEWYNNPSNAYVYPFTLTSTVLGGYILGISAPTGLLMVLLFAAVFASFMMIYLFNRRRSKITQ